jgi:electron transport complex protein RnfE
MSEKKPSFSRSFFVTAVKNNPVLFQCAGLCPAIAGTSSVKDSIFVAAVLSLDLVLTALIACTVLRKIPRYIRIAVYLVLGLAIIYPILWYIENRTLVEITLGIRIILPLISVNSLTAMHCETFSVKHKVGISFINAVCAAIGSSIVIVICGILREIIGKGSVAGYSLDINTTLKTMTMPFGCLILLGFLAAFLKTVQKSPAKTVNTGSDGPVHPEEIALDIEQDEAPETVELVFDDYEEIDLILSSTDEFLKSLTGSPDELGGMDE